MLCYRYVRQLQFMCSNKTTNNDNTEFMFFYFQDAHNRDIISYRDVSSVEEYQITQDRTVNHVCAF